MHTVLEKLPRMAKDTKLKVTQALEVMRSTAYISQDKVNPLKLAEYLHSKYNEDLIEAMKILFAMLLQNKNLNVYLARIINLLPREDLELKRICYAILLEVAAERVNQEINTSQGDVLLLSISPIYKDIVSFNTSIKFYALKALPGLKITEITHLIISSLKQMVVDKNQLVRKVAALTILKLKDLTPDEISEDLYLESMQFLLRDSPSVRCAAIYTLVELGHDLSFLHQHYFQMIKDLPQLNHLEMELALNTLHRYIQRFLKPNDPEVNILFDQCERMLKLPYPNVVVTMAKIFLEFPQIQRLKKVVKTLTRFLNIASESKFITLCTLHKLAIIYPELLREYYRSFTIIQIEKLYCKIKKLEIIYLLIDESNFSLILEELLHHTRSNQPQLVGVAVQLLGLTSQKYPQFLKRTVRSLVELLRHGTSESKNHATIAFCSLMSGTPSPQLLPFLTLCLQYIDDIQDILYKSYIIRLLRREHKSIPSIAAENLRKLTLKFLSQHENVKYEILLLAFELNEENQLENHQQIILIYKYLLTLAQYDQSFLLRDLARALQNEAMMRLKFSLDELFVSSKLHRKDEKPSRLNELQVGTFSHLVGYEMKGYRKPEEKLEEDTSKLRKVVQPQEEKKVQQVPSAVIQKPEAQIQKIPQIQQPPVEDNKKKKKAMEEEVKKHYSNLDQTLNDFFSDE